ncbi:uncharacterized protein F5891DRAFT_980043 [Suillus fuscotomentosus]|uniref:Uncharacterized protein n=1 Tax=Suillus fuscotomentosus TaxID=1912939 RepID=A0AAD4E9D4_9AGAM|nr:uncharacterized protein F5891DRAFT_980043 [Suillus fuscotomentosus]KAG1900829.1 hypothetical protein F5891DRAFT_980043 [Suillus fuscotomentosus]
MIPAYYKNGLRFLNHIIICLQELLQHLGPSSHWDILQLKYEAFGRELLVLSKIRKEFIQEVQNEFRFHQPGVKNMQWMSPVLNSFLAYMYYCGSVNPQHKPHMMNVHLDDPQTYNWHSWANNQEIPGLWGRLPEHPAEYQTAIFEAINAKIALEPNTESSGSCSEMWCKGIINMMVQIKQKIQDRSSADKSVLEVLESSVDIVKNNGCEKPVKKGRGRPKGVLNSTIMELQSLPKSPMKLRSKNSARSSFLSQNDDAISERSLPEVVQEDMRDDISRTETIQSDMSSAFKRAETLNQRTLKSDQLSLNQQTDLRAASNSSKTRPIENDVPALDLSKLFCKKFHPKFGKSLLLSTPWDYSLDTCMVPNKESESSLYDEVIDQAMDINVIFQNTSTSNSRDISLEISEDVIFSSPIVSLNCSEEFDQTTSVSPVSSSLSKDDLPIQVDSSLSLPVMEDKESLFIPSSSLSSQEESAQTSLITSKTSKGTLIFTKSLDEKFVYDSVTFVPNALKSQGKTKAKSKGKGKSKDLSEFIQSSQRNHEIPPKSISQIQTRKEKEKRKMVISDESSTADPSPSIKSMTTLTLPANISKSDELQNNIKQQIRKAMTAKDVQKQIKTDMDIIVRYVYWMKTQKDTVKLSKEPKIGFKCWQKVQSVRIRVSAEG